MVVHCNNTKHIKTLCNIIMEIMITMKTLKVHAEKRE